MARASLIAVVMCLIGAPLLYAQDAQPKISTDVQTKSPRGIQPQGPSPSQEIFMALGGGDLTCLGALLVAGANPNARDPQSGKTLLMAADNAAMVQLLLEHGADPALQDNQGATALHHAVTSSEALKIIPHLLVKGADVNARAAGLSHETPFMAAKNLFFQHRPVCGAKVLQLLAQNGADINSADESGYTVLISAVVNDKPELVRLMIELGADADHQANDGLTAIGWARELGFVDIIDLLEASKP
jgi:uncharacterized protein